VYGMTWMQSCAAEYVLLSSKYKHTVSKIPEGLSFEEAASLPSVAHTVICTLLRADNEVPGGLKGKTVFVPAGLGGCGSTALMLLKSVYGAGKVITTVSTKKVALVTGMLGEGVVDQVIDYTKQDVVREIGVGTVDFMFDTAMTVFPYIAVLKPGTGAFYYREVGGDDKEGSSRCPVAAGETYGCSRCDAEVEGVEVWCEV